MAAVSTYKTFGDVGEIFTQDGYAINEEIGLATVAEKVLKSPYLMVAYLDFPAFNLCLLHQLYQGVLVITVIVKGKAEWLSACVHSCLGEVQPSFPAAPDDPFSGKLYKVSTFSPLE